MIEYGDHMSEPVRRDQTACLTTVATWRLAPEG
jgi:hypothetical protein